MDRPVSAIARRWWRHRSPPAMIQGEAGMHSVFTRLALAGLMMLAAQQAWAERFDFFVIGDAPYCVKDRYLNDGRCTPDEMATNDDLVRLKRLQGALNAARPAFTVHIGDIKAGAEPCADAIYDETLDLFNRFTHPFIYTPGDNEWSDCRLAGVSVAAHQEDRLRKIQSTFFKDPSRSLGTPPRSADRIRLEYQPEAVENARWQMGGVQFATIHTVGNDNNFAANPAEFHARDDRTAAWVIDTFKRAKADSLRAVVLFTQADPRFEEEPGQGNRRGFDRLISVLADQTVKFGKPVVFIHGDTHLFRVDKPLCLDGRRCYHRGAAKLIETFTRVEVFGAPEVHAVRVRVDTDSKQESDLFWFQPVMIRENFHQLP